MPTLHEQYSELIALSQLFLLREHHLNDKVPTDPLTFASLFRKETIHPQPQPQPQQKFAKEPPTPQPAPRPLPPPSQPEPAPKPTIPEPSPPEPRPPTIIDIDKGLKKISHFASFNLETLPKSPVSEFQDFKNIVKEHFPNYPLAEQIPSDSKAKKIKNNWQVERQIPPIVILSFNEQERHLSFLKNVAQAITLNITPARVISAIHLEKENKWEPLLNSPELQMIIASDYGLYLLPGLMKHYREAPKNAKHFLNKTPLLLLSDISLYLKETQLKPLLWRAICTEFEFARQLK